MYACIAVFLAAWTNFLAHGGLQSWISVVVHICVSFNGELIYTFVCDSLPHLSRVPDNGMF